MTDICFYFQVHQPFRLRRYSVFDIGKSTEYFDEKKNEEVMKKVAGKCYLPANKVILELIRKHDGNFKAAYSITGTAIEQFEKYAPEVLDSFKELASTKCVEFLSETYYHSLSYLYSKDEFKDQVEMHRKAMKKHFGFNPKVFRNTELIYNNELANFVEKLGYKAILAEGADHILGWKSPNFVYKPKTTRKMRLLLKNYKLSDDIAFRFSNKGWEGYPLTAKKYADWIEPAMGDTINLFMDYETFGEHQWEDTGIFNFLSHLPGELLKRNISFHTPSELIAHEPKDEIDVHHMMSWADVERDLSAWLSNKMQQSAIQELFSLRTEVIKSRDKELIERWRKMTTSDHFYYMCVKWFNDGDVHKYFNPYDNPYDAFITFMNIMNDLIVRLKGEDLNRQTALRIPTHNTKWVRV
ncbi:glycoside hydrolase family 57 protein [Candidatus Woesearchaeota archaeon]|nr:glycoside hydrolase family 57 protein [Candidatus Woesearchaeota archaeon]